MATFLISLWLLCVAQTPAPIEATTPQDTSMGISDVKVSSEADVDADVLVVEAQESKKAIPVLTLSVTIVGVTAAIMTLFAAVMSLLWSRKFKEAERQIIQANTAALEAQRVAREASLQYVSYRRGLEAQIAFTRPKFIHALERLNKEIRGAFPPDEIPSFIETFLKIVVHEGMDYSQYAGEAIYLYRDIVDDDKKLPEAVREENRQDKLRFESAVKFFSQRPSLPTKRLLEGRLELEKQKLPEERSMFVMDILYKALASIDKEIEKMKQKTTTEETA